MIGTRVWTAASTKYSVLMLLNRFQCHVTEIKEIELMKVLESAELWEWVKTDMVELITQFDWLASSAKKT